MSTLSDLDDDTGAPRRMCVRCYAETDDLHEPNCTEQPELLRGAALGMYHCPDCGAMLLAGVPHGPLCRLCLERRNPEFDRP